MSFRFRSQLVRRALAGLALTGVIALGACGDDSSGPSGDVYTLFSVDGATLPIVETDPATGDVFTLKSGVIALKANGTYTVRITETYKPSGAPLETYVYGENGTYTLEGTTLTTTSTHDFEDGVLTPVTIATVTTSTKDGNTITANSNGIIFIFKK